MERFKFKTKADIPAGTEVRLTFTPPEDKPVPSIPPPSASLPPGKMLFGFDGFTPSQIKLHNGWASNLKTPRRRLGKYVLRSWPPCRFHVKPTVPPATIHPNGIVEFRVTKDCPDKKGHVEWTPEHTDLIDGAYLRQDETYHFWFTSRIKTIDAVMEGEQGKLLTFFQVWGPSTGYPKGKHLMPPLALNAYKKKLNVLSYGSTQNRSPKENWVKHGKSIGTPDGDWHDWKVVYRPSTRDGMLYITLDGQIVIEYSGKPNCLATEQTGWAGQFRFGCYSSPAPKDTAMQFRSMMVAQE